MGIEEINWYESYKSLGFSDYFILAAITCVMSFVVCLLTELGLVPCKACKGKLKFLNWIHLVFWLCSSLGVILFICVDACFEWSLIWCCIFGISLLMDVVVFQTVLALVKFKIAVKGVNTAFNK